ncbi:invasion protein IalB [Rhizobium petrolearium]|uniref:invasion associated locus B family protein n=1 Tax=Neorhizobium petrolearium TaxID=515361 RepID=UPI001AE63330|nr:invasion associated locus B family protein [Neorhizobium petrolearium]MBP1848072.1 invasion protein IalB [Neorhizobium petrolearium]
MIIHNPFKRALTAALLLGSYVFPALQDQALAQTAQATLPGGASSLQETYQDWRVACGVAQSGKVCSMSQVQQQQNGQRILAIELQPSKDGSVTGVLAMPFGLQLDAGANLKIDNNPPLPNLRFSTCVPAGCLLPVNFSAANVATLKTAATLNITAISLEASQPVNLSVSLKGFAAALERLNQLLKG